MSTQPVPNSPRPEEKVLADALDMSVQAFGEYFNLKVGLALANIVRTEVAQAMQRTLAGQMAVDISDVLKKEVQNQIAQLRDQIKVEVSLNA